jgi:hypothetical protein
MKKELLPQFLFLAIYFLLITLVKRWFSILYLPFWIGGFVGMFLPYIDHLIYIYFLRPQEEVSGRLKLMLSQRKFKSAFEFFVGINGKGTRKIFHTVHFQLIFLTLTLLVVTSSDSLFGIGLVLGFALHLWTTQLKDFMNDKTITDWFEKVGVMLDREKQMWYLGINGVVLLILGLLL